ncbi:MULTISPECIES: fascin domain-containing protein [Photorhabdus]|uniref:Uncharacterized protein n=1 Tax=Photorhabdus asymbiotica subsp. asymbiotica (strain ATCC 43949 / 3105-77) TaxID=553480 RepID=C7BLX7_PHOAA|nr:hypothetical protein [Photorhabdus asymbiotica]CAQ85833.1 conserved hypothetical Protein [Photorhabdus asymbiotica]
MSRVNQIDGDFIEAEKTNIDIFSIFTVEDVGCNVVALRADNGKYLSRVSLDGINYIKPEKANIYPSSFKLPLCWLHSLTPVT